MKAIELFAALILTSGACWGQLEGVIDVHAHVDPETIPRSVDAMDLARLARKEGMRGVVFKNHFVPTAPLAFLVGREVPGIEVFGGVALNRPVGGINPAAVEQMAQMRGGYGRIVWMPTFDARRIPVSEGGELLPAVIEVLEIMAREDLALATGHIVPDDGLLLIRKAREMGIDRIIVTHPVNRWSIEEQQQAAEMGAYLEYCYVGTLEYAGNGRRTMAEYAERMRTLGPDNVIMSSDLGNAANPVHPAGLKSYIEALLEEGITQEQVDVMLKRNPARLLGLD